MKMSNDRIFLHERLFRNIEIHAQKLITICGAGAIGGNLAILMASQNFVNLRIIDKDRIEERNVGTQPYTLPELRSYKANSLRKYLYRKCKAHVEPHIVELKAENAVSLLKGSDLVVDAFDNSKSRRTVKETCEELDIVCVHSGMSADGYSEVVWNDSYEVPQDEGIDLCEYPLALNLVWMTTALTSEAILLYIHKGEKKSYFFTLRDFKLMDADV